MKYKILLPLFLMVCSCHVYSLDEYAETVPPSGLIRYDTVEHKTLLLAIGHKPIGKKDSFAGLYYEKDAITGSYSVTSLGIIAFNFSRQETPDNGAEVRVGLSRTEDSGDVREGFDFGIIWHSYLSENIAIGVGGILRPTLLSYRSYEDYITEYKAHVGMYYTATDYLKLSALYRYDGVLLEEVRNQYTNDGFQVRLSLLF